MAAACGIAEVTVVEEAAQLDALARRVNALGAGPMVAVVKIDEQEKPRCLPTREGVVLKARLRRALGFESM